MKATHLPYRTIILLITMAALHFLVPDRSPLFFSADHVMAGEGWRLFSGHLVHADLAHLFWNSLGLAVLGGLIERRSPGLWWASLTMGVLAVDILLLMPYAGLDYYCGLSGVLNTLLVITLWLEWLATRSAMVIAVAVACLAKTLIEVALGSSVLTHISWPPYPWSHVAGMAGGFMLIALWIAAAAMPKQPVSKHSLLHSRANRDVSATKTA